MIVTREWPEVYANWIGDSMEMEINWKHVKHESENGFI